MKSFIATVLLASAAIVSAQISALPQCGIVCGLAAAKNTSCVPVTNFNCTCQYSNQAIILPILSSCLAKSCDSSAQSSAAISAGEGICATVSQTASGTSAIATSTSSVASTTAMSSSATPTSGSKTASFPTPTSSSTGVAAYTGGAAMATVGVKGLVAAAGMAILAL